jgi:osmoprotectant transport system substrate-binding protein
VATWIERTTDLSVRRRLHLGGTFICHEALTTGELDLYVEYTGTALTAILERPPVQDPDSVLRAVRRAYRERWNLAWTEPLGFENTFAMLVRRSTADSLGLESVSDLAEHAGDLRLGVNYEFVEREDGLPGLRETYGMRFRGEPRTMELGLIYRALAEGKVDVVAGNSTDGQVEALDLAMLEDDRRYFPPYHAAPVVDAALLERHPELRRSLERLGGLIDTPEMRRLNRQVDVEGRDFRQVARDWVERTLAGEAAPAAYSSGRFSAIIARRSSSHGGSRSPDPSSSTLSSTVKPGPSVAISNSTPPGSRK